MDGHAAPMMTSAQLPVTVLCGFLGSGKTTLLRRWRREDTLRGAALIVHDLSEFGLDAELLSGDDVAPEAGRLVGRVAALHGVHARERLHDSVGRILGGIASLDPAPPHVLCESTGVARPWPLVSALTQDDRFVLRHFIVVVDALNLHRDFADGRMFTGEAPASDDPAIARAAALLVEQLAFASAIVLTKVDLLPRSVVDAQIRTLQQLRPTATFGLSAQAGLGLAQLDRAPPPDSAELARRAEQLGLTRTAATADEVGAIVFRDAIERNLLQAQLCADLVRDSASLELMMEPQLSTVVFRHKSPQAENLNEHNRELAQALKTDGRVYAAAANIDGEDCLRVCFVNYRTQDHDVHALIEVVTEIGAMLNQAYEAQIP